MKKIKVDSSNIISIGHEKEILEVEFKSGKIYRYTDVVKDVYDELLKADSIGSYFHNTIKGKFQFKEITKLDEIKESIRSLIYAEFCLIEDFIKEVRDEHERI